MVSSYVILSKITTPSLPKDYLARDALVQQIGAEQYAVCVFCAPAGYGKSSLAIELASHQAQKGCSIAWLSLDENDNEVSRFAMYLVATLSAHLELDIHIAEQAANQRVSELMPFIAEVINALAQSEPLMVVLDDVHVLTDRQILEGLKYLVKYLPEQITLIFTSRQEPKIGIQRLRAMGKALVLGDAELRLNREQTQSFVDLRLHCSLAPELLSGLEKSFEGWIGGLQLLTLSCHSDSDVARFIQQGHSAQLVVEEYLAEEVYLRQQPEVREFLLASSVLSRFDIESLQQVTGIDNALAILDYLQKTNMFISVLDAERHWFRFHSLFRDFLNKECQRQDPERYRDINSRAFDWWISQQDPAEAASYALQSNNVEQLKRLVEEHGWEFYHRGHVRLLMKLIDALPELYIVSTPMICSMVCWINFALVRNAEKVAYYLAQAKTVMKTHLSADDYYYWMGIFGCLECDIAIGLHQYAKAEALAEDAIKRVGEHNPAASTGFACIARVAMANADFARAEEYLGLAHRCVEKDSIPALFWYAYLWACLSVRRGSLSEARRWHEKGLKLNKKEYLTAISSSEYMLRSMSQVCRLSYQVTDAAQYADQAIDYALRWGEIWSYPCKIERARILLLEQKYGLADDIVQQLLVEMQTVQFTEEWIAELLELMMHYAILTGNNHLRWPKSDLPRLMSFPETSVICQQCIRVSTYLSAVHEAEPELSVLERLYQLANESGLVLDGLENALLLAIIHPDKGFDYLIEAVGLAYSQDIVGPFLRYKSVLLKDYERLVELRSISKEELSFSTRIIQLCKLRPGLPRSNDDDYPEAVRAIPLTRKEWRVLTLIGQGLSNEEISDKQCVALSTVKSHIRALYRKLGIKKRPEAIARYQQLKPD
jgi:LuxR family maltose regulon positive regulatory protein